MWCLAASRRGAVLVRALGARTAANGRSGRSRGAAGGRGGGSGEGGSSSLSSSSSAAAAAAALTVAQLKSLLRSRGEHVGGRKADLVARVLATGGAATLGSTPTPPGSTPTPPGGFTSRGGGGRRGFASRGGGELGGGSRSGASGLMSPPRTDWGLDRPSRGRYDARRRSASSSASDADARLASTSSLQDHSFDPDALQRVSKLMAWRGLCSRREAEVLIARGEVLVDGVVVEQGAKATREARIELAGANADSWLRDKVTIVLNKPPGFVSNLPGRGEMEASALVTTRNARGSTNRQSTERAAAAAETSALNVCGRLDKDSRGLLVMTQDGALAKALIGGNEIPKTYEVEVDREVTVEHLTALNGPVSLEGVQLLPMHVERLAPRKMRFVLREGKKRQIRRVCQGAGLRVVDLMRVRVGACELGDLPEGRWRLMTEREREALRAAGTRSTEAKAKEISFSDGEGPAVGPKGKRRGR